MCLFYRTTWQQALEYHKPFIKALMSDNTTKSTGLLDNIFFTCLTFDHSLDYTVGFFIELLMHSKVRFKTSLQVNILCDVW